MMTKRGVWWTYGSIVLLLFLFSSHMVTAQVSFQAGDEKTLQRKIVSMANTFPLTRYAGDGADVCLVINAAPNKTFSYRVFKNSELVEVTASPYSTYCANDIYNKGPEDFVIQYVDYDSFIDHYRDPSCENFKHSGNGEDFYYLESEFVAKGGVPVCNALFQERYCPAVRQCLGRNEMKFRSLDCCIERRVFEIPGGFSNMYFLIALALLLAAIFISSMVFVRHHHQSMLLQPQQKQQVTRDLLMYTEKALSLGYSQEEVKVHLSQLGWQKETIELAFAEVLKRWLVAKEEKERR